MATLRLRIEINKGRKGVPLDKLERVIRETRKFLSDMAEDLRVSEPEDWGGMDFRNGSLSYTAFNPSTVNPAVYSRFTEGVTELASNRTPSFIRPTTVTQFQEIVQPLVGDELLRLGLFPEDGKRMKWLTVSKASLSPPLSLVQIERESIGSIQGVIHSLFKESKPPYFHLRDLFSGQLVKCSFGEDDYEAIVEALRVPDRVVHVHGLFRETGGTERRITSIEVDRVILADSYTFADLTKFLDSGTVQ